MQARDYEVLGRIGGRQAVESGQILALGRWGVESGHIKRMSTPETRRKGGLIACHLVSREAKAAGGRTSGRMAVENGRLASLRTAEHQRAAGRIGGKTGGRTQGLKNAESGQLALIRTKENCGKGGRIGARIQKEQGLGIFAPGYDRSVSSRIGSRIANHNRWHVNRDIVNPVCSLCQSLQAKAA
jgi:hypothetical protein